jgi:two-component system, OmpR family, sensor kinase
MLSGLAIATLSVAASLLAFWVVRQSLYETLERGLRADARSVVEVWSRRGPGTAELQEGPTGGVHVQLYNPEGALVSASSERYSQDAVEVAAVLAANTGDPIVWRGELDGRPVSAALMRSEAQPAIFAVLAPTGHINDSLRQLGQALAVTAFVLTLLSGLSSYLVAAAAMKPVTDLAKIAAALDVERLKPITYEGPADEVGQLTKVLNDLTGRLKASLDAQRVFLAETSHELRTPLTSLQGFLDRAARRAGPEAAAELQDARRIAQSMSRLVVDLLQLSRGELVREYEPHLLDPHLDIVMPVAEEFPGVRLRPQPGLVLLGDPEKLRQLLRNLVANAVRAADHPEGVELELAEEDGVVFRVRDRGPGIPADILPHIFVKFYRGMGGGTGLGLAIAKQIVDMHQGTIEVKSAPGEGAVFTVRLPIYVEEADEEPFEEVRLEPAQA